MSAGLVKKIPWVLDCAEFNSAYLSSDFHKEQEIIDNK